MVNAMYEELFRSNFSNEKSKKIAIYGTGVIANEITLTCKDFNIVGLIDRQLIGADINGIRIYDIKDLGKLGAEQLIIAAQPQNLNTIYFRIKNIVDLLEIKVFDVWGNVLPDPQWSVKSNFQGINCTEDDFEQLKDEIRKHDIVSFDIFDTLLMRLVYEPHDIFDLVEIQAKKSNIYSGQFKEERIRAEISLISTIPTLEEIYTEIRNFTHLDKETIDKLMNLEIEIERKLLIPRKKVVELFQYAKELGKKLYIITDMYLPTVLLKDILESNGIEGYIKIFNSCDYHKPKVNGLYKEFANEVLNSPTNQGKKCLHIGDYELADGECPKIEGIDSHIIEKGVSIFEKSQFGELRQYMSGINERLLVGMWIGKILNNPFCIRENKIVIDDKNSLTWAGVGTLLSVLVEWLRVQKENSKKKVLLSSRDGWLIKKILENDDDFSYFYTSRLALKKCYSDKKTFEFYKNYLEVSGIKKSEEYLFFDLVSSGSCLLYLSELFGLKLKGTFLCRYDTNNPKRQKLDILSMLEENENSNFRKYYLFFEMLLTSMEPSLVSFTDIGEPVFEEELRTQEEIELVFDLQKTLIDHYKIYGQYSSADIVNMELLDGLLDVYNEAITIHSFKEKSLFCIYDSYGVGRISLY